jgi:hypothetical protein
MARLLDTASVRALQEGPSSLESALTLPAVWPKIPSNSFLSDGTTELMAKAQNLVAAADLLARERKRLIGLGKPTQAAEMAGAIRKVGFLLKETSSEPGCELQTEKL